MTDREGIEHRERATRFIRETPAVPPSFRGRGIVICGGGVKYFTCAWVCINMLRHRGCQLPIELYYLGRHEMDESMQEALRPLGVRCIDGYSSSDLHKPNRLGGWELKAYAMLRSRFAEVCLLDADNVPLIDPEEIFDWPQYQETGAVFWPDFHPIGKDSPIWQASGVPYRYEPSFETGQIVVDKRRCWAALRLAVHYGDESGFYYQHTGGDKDSFHIAWRRVGKEYSMVPYHVKPLNNAAMLQHDFEGKLIFQHRHGAKWQYADADNERAEGFVEEDQCLQYLAALREVWNGRVSWPVPDSPSCQALARQIRDNPRFLYRRVDHDARFMTLASDQTISEGAASLEQTWHIDEGPKGQAVLCICSNWRDTCRLMINNEGTLSGQWLVHEEMPIEMVPVALLQPTELTAIECELWSTELRHSDTWLIRVSEDRQRVTLEEDGRFTFPSKQSPWNWEIEPINDRPTLRLRCEGKDYRQLERDGDGVWREPKPASHPPIEVIALPRI